MALWGNNDNVSVQSGGTVEVNYDTLEVIGTGTTFGTAGFAGTGQVIRFGVAGRVGSGATYYGDATIVGIASTTSLSIASTIGLTGTAIGGTTFTVTECPQYTTTDPSFSLDPTYSHSAPSFKTIRTGSAATDVSVAIGASVVPVDLLGDNLDIIQHIQVGDVVVNDGNDLSIVSIGTFVANATQTSAIGFSTLFVAQTTIPGVGTASDSFPTDVRVGTQTIQIVSVGATAIGLAHTISAAVTAGSQIEFVNNFAVGLAGTITAGIATGDSLVFKRLMAGYDRYMYGVSGDGVNASAGSAYQVAHAGWVGVTTYIDTHGNLRVKNETLVAMSGISTGNSPVYDSDPTAGN